MKNLNKFIKELFDLKFDTKNESLSLENYFEVGQTYQYSTKLKILSEMAMSDVLTLTPEQVKWQLTRFDLFKTHICDDVDDCLTFIDALLKRDGKNFDITEWLYRIGDILNMNIALETLQFCVIDDLDTFVECLNIICVAKSDVLEEFYENLKEITQKESKYDEKITKSLDKQTKRTFQKSDMRLFSYYLFGVSEDDFDEFYDVTKPYIEGTREEVHNVFYGSYLHEVNPLIWKSNNASELLYFITQLMDRGLLKPEKRIDYQRLKACFVKASGSEFDESFKDLYQKLNTSLSISKKEAIDKLIEKFL